MNLISQNLFHLKVLVCGGAMEGINLGQHLKVL